MMFLEKVNNKINYHKCIQKKKAFDAKTGQITNWAIMGLGHMANTFVKALSTTPGARVIAAASRSQQKSDDFAKKYGIPNSYESYESMLEDESIKIDIVYIATPVFCHYDNIKMSLLHNKNVLCEKPIVLESDQLEELHGIALERGLFLSEGLWMLCLPTIKKAKEWLELGKIGRLQGIRVDLSKCELIDYSNSKYSANEGGGVLLDYGIYPITFASNFMSGNVSIKYVSSIVHFKGFDKDWTIILDDGYITATITISSDFEGSRKAVLIGENGSIVWNAQFNRTNTVSCINSEGTIVNVFSAKYVADGFEYEISEIQSCLHNKKFESDSVPISTSMQIIDFMKRIKQQK